MKRIIALISAVVLLLNLLGCGKAEKEDRSIDSMRSFARYAPMVFATETADTIYGTPWRAVSEILRQSYRY